MKVTSILSEDFTTLDVLSKVSVVAFYLAISLIALYVILAIVLKKFKPEKLSLYNKIMKAIYVFIALVFALLLGGLKLKDMVETGEFNGQLFYPILSILIVGILIFIGGIIVRKKKPEFLQKYKFISIICILIPIIVSIIMLALYYKTVAEYYEGVSEAGLYASAIILVVLLIGVTSFVSKNKGPFTTREMAYAAISIALSFALSYIRFFKLPQGGSITLASMLPIMLFSYMFGVKKGMVVGLIYGVLQAIQDPWIIHPAQFFLDYPIAFGMMAFAGFYKEVGFNKKPLLSFTLGAITAGVMRYISHILSGIFAFASYVGEGYSVVAWSFLYNTFTLVDTAIVILFAVILFSSKNFVRLVLSKSEQ